MGKIKPELSATSSYWIDRHRYYELKHFCLQYPIWKQAYFSLDGLSKHSSLACMRSLSISKPTERCAEARMFYLERMTMIEQAAINTDPALSDYILKAVTEDLSYEAIKAKLNIPCCRDVYYSLYRRFFWILNKMRK